MIREFATEHRLKVTRDGEGEDIEHVIVGRIGQSQIYQHSENELGVLFMTDGRKPPRTGLFNTFRDACLEVGMTVHQLGDAEGSFLFDPMNSKQAKGRNQGHTRTRKEANQPRAGRCGSRTVNPGSNVSREDGQTTRRKRNFALISGFDRRRDGDYPSGDSGPRKLSRHVKVASLPNIRPEQGQTVLASQYRRPSENCAKCGAEGIVYFSRATGNQCERCIQTKPKRGENGSQRATVAADGNRDCSGR